MRVAVYNIPAGGGFSTRRMRMVAQAMAEGLKRHGVRHEVLKRYEGVQADVAVAYGWVHGSVFEAYRAAGAHFAYWDLGYWHRRPVNDSANGYHRLALNSWDTADSMLRGCPSDRFDSLGLQVHEQPTRGNTILITAMSEKAARSHGYQFNQWEQAMQRHIRQLDASYPVTVRAKPSKRVKAAGTIDQALAAARLLVTHHSNTAVDALMAGVPAFCIKGVGSILSPGELTTGFIKDPVLPSLAKRRALFADIAYAQWTPHEMRSGAAWNYIREVICE